MPGVTGKKFVRWCRDNAASWIVGAESQRFVVRKMVSIVASTPHTPKKKQIAGGRNQINYFKAPARTSLVNIVIMGSCVSSSLQVQGRGIDPLAITNRKVRSVETLKLVAAIRRANRDSHEFNDFFYERPTPAQYAHRYFDCPFYSFDGALINRKKKVWCND